MSKVNKSEPKDIKTLADLVDAIRRERKPVIFTDQKCQAKDFSCKNKPEVEVFDLTAVVQSNEKPTATTREGAGPRWRGRNSIHPVLEPTSSQKPEPCRCRVIEDDEPDDSSCSCFGKKPAKHRDNVKALRQRVGDDFKLEIEEFENWGETFRQIVVSAYPKTKDHITKLIRAAKEIGLRVRCAGSGHSWTPIFADAGQILLQLDKLKSDYSKGVRIKLSDKMLVGVSVDKRLAAATKAGLDLHCLQCNKKNHVDVMAGTSVADFKMFMLKHDLCMSASVLFDIAEVNGIISTGSHGTGWDALTPGDYLRKMRIFDSDGNLRVYTNEDPEMMNAVSASFGAFGIIYDMTFELAPKRTMVVKHEYVPAKSVLNDPAEFKRYVESNWSVQFFWLPFNSRAIFEKYDPMEDEVMFKLINDDTSGEPEEDDDYYDDKDRMDYITSTGMEASAFLYRNFPSLTPVLLDAAFSLMQSVYPDDRDIHQALPHAIHYRKYLGFTPLSDLEFVFDLNGNYERVTKVVKVVMDLMVKYNKQGKYPLNVCVEMRWMAYSNSFLCPASIGNPANGGSGHVFYIEIVSLANTPHWKEFSIEVAQQWAAQGGIPHLAKEWDYVPNMYGVIKKKLVKGISQFKKQLQKSKADPKGMFVNNTLCQLIG